MLARLALAFGLSLAAPAAAQEISRKAPIYKAAVEYGLDYGLALEIGKKCRSLRFVHRAAKAEEKALNARFKDAGYTQSDARKLIKLAETDPTLQRRVFQYIEKNNIVVTDRDSFCAPGFREIKRGSRIGRFLKAR